MPCHMYMLVHVGDNDCVVLTVHACIVVVQWLTIISNFWSS